MPNKRIALFAASGFLAALCGLAGPARAQYADSLRRRLSAIRAPPPVVAPVPVSPYPYLFGNQRYCWYNFGLERPRLVLLRLRLPPRLWLGRRLWLEQLALERTRGTRRLGTAADTAAADTAAADTAAADTMIIADAAPERSIVIPVRALELLAEPPRQERGERA